MRLTDQQRRAVRHGLAISGLIVAAYFYIVVGDTTWQRPAADGLIYWGVDLSDLYAGSTVCGANACRLLAGLCASVRHHRFAAATRLRHRLDGIPRDGRVVARATMARVTPGPRAPSQPGDHDRPNPPGARGRDRAWVPVERPAWAFVLLTKVTPGMGLLWFVVRREWRALLIAYGHRTRGRRVVRARPPGVGRMDRSPAPRRWHPGPGTGRQAARGRRGRDLGGLSDRRWTVPLAAMLALPVIWVDSFSMLLGCVAVSAHVRRGVAMAAAIVSRSRLLTRGPPEPPKPRCHG